MSCNSEKKCSENGNCKQKKCCKLNPHLQTMENDFLYHLAVGTESHDLVKMFGDVKYVCMGGTNARMKTFAELIVKELNLDPECLVDISVKSNRFCMYKVGPVLSVSHGMGISSISILLHEVIKLMHHAKVKDPEFFRIGTCGGIGVEPGTVIVSNGAVDGMLQTDYIIPMLGKLYSRPAILDKEFAEHLKLMGDELSHFKTITGKTMCASDFYEEQGRTDGAFCTFTETDKFDYLNHLHKNGVRNIEMEAIPFAALTHQAGIKSAIVCVALVNRLVTDQVLTPKETLNAWQEHPQQLIVQYIKNQIIFYGLAIKL